jgi:hypothetical protein
MYCQLYGYLASQRDELLRDEDFANLYCCDNGRPSVPPRLLAARSLAPRSESHSGWCCAGVLALSAVWVAATAGAMAVGVVLGQVLLGDDTAIQPLLLRALITGIAIGSAQAALLRGILPSSWVWAMTVAVAWALGWAVTAAAGIDLPRKWTVFGSSGALTFQLATDLTLAFLLRRNAAAIAPAPAVAR